MPSLYLPQSDQTTTEAQTLLINNLTCPDNEFTRFLVSQSASNQLKGFALIISSLLDTQLISPDHPNIHMAKRRIQEEWTENTITWLSSPIFRSWIHRFVYHDGNLLVNDRVQQFVNEIANYCLDLYNDHNIDTSLVCKNGKIELYRSAFSIRWPEEGLVPVSIKANTISLGKQQDQPALIIEKHNSPNGVYLAQQQASKGCELVFAPSLPHSQNIVVSNDLPSLRVALDFSRSPDRESTYQAARVETSACYYPKSSTAFLEKSCDWLAQAWGEEFKDWKLTLHVVVPFQSCPGWTVGGFTISSMQGACWIANGRDVQVLENLVHEQSHVKLRYLEEYLPILESEQEQQFFQVGWRTDPRPLIGIYEGIYVNIHVMESFRRILEICQLTYEQRIEIIQRGRELHRQVQEASSILASHARFTELGTVYKDWMFEQLSQLHF